MNLSFINLPFNERITQALCWTLVHSLWEGLLLAIVAGVVILSTRRSAPSLRYGLFSALFFLFILGTCFTFIRQWDHAATTGRGEALLRIQDQPLAGRTLESGAHGVITLPAHPGLMDGMVNYFNEHAYFIVALWFIIFSARLVKIMAQLGTVQRLRHYRVHAPSGYWTKRLRELAALLEIKKKVTLLESEIVKVPVMTGLIKPVILLPFSLLSQLPPAQVEAILLHELAHIRRGDYFANLLFSCGELLFFFNPGLLWICALIREERENCCDDIAVREAGSKKEFISALVSFQQYDQIPALSAMAFPGSGNHLLHRVRRIVYRDNKILDSREKFFLLFCFLISGFLMLAFTRSYPAGKTVRLQRNVVSAQPERPIIRAAVKVSVPAANFPVGSVAHARSAQYADEARVPISKDTAAPPHSKASPSPGQSPGASPMPEKDTLDEEQPPLEILEKALEAQQAKLDLEEQRLNLKMKMLRDRHKDTLWQQEKLYEQEVKIAAQQKRLFDNECRIVDENRRIETQKMRMIEQQSFLADRAFENAAELKGPFRDSVVMRMKFRMDTVMHGRRSIGTVNDRLAMVRSNQKILLPVIDEMTSEHLIDNRDELSFTLNDKELIINGVRQPDEVFQRFRKKYLGDPKDYIIYSKKKGGYESTSINVHTITI